MCKLIIQTYVTLDGVVENPHLWPALPLGHAEEGDALQTDLLMASDIVLMGRRTYEVFAPVWPTRSGDPYSDRINAMRKVVASTTLTDPDWANTEVLAHGLVERIRALKAEDGGGIVQYGFGAVSEQLIAEGLVDELHMWIHPQFVAATHDELLFRPALEASFELASSQVLSNGIVVCRYATSQG